MKPSVEHEAEATSDDVHIIETILCAELKKVREAERWLTAAFEKLPVECEARISIGRFLYQLDRADERLDRLELLLDMMDKSDTVAA
jgi:hypothetical protein